MRFLIVFRSVTFTNDLWIKFSEGWRKLLRLPFIWGLLQANRSVNEEMRGYTRPQNAIFDAFSLRVLDQWPLDQIFPRGDAKYSDCRSFEALASESTIKRRNETVHQATKYDFWWLFAPCRWRMTSGSNFPKGDANYSDCSSFEAFCKWINQ